MPHLAFAVAPAVVVGFFVAGYLRDNVPPLDCRFALVLNPPTIAPALVPDLTPIAVALAVVTTASVSPGPAPVFAVAAVLSMSSTNRSGNFGGQLAGGVHSVP